MRHINWKLGEKGEIEKERREGSHTEKRNLGSGKMRQHCKRRIAMAKEVFNKKRSIFCEPLEKELRKRLGKYFLCSVRLYGAKTWTL